MKTILEEEDLILPQDSSLEESVDTISMKLGFEHLSQLSPFYVKLEII